MNVNLRIAVDLQIPEEALLKHLEHMSPVRGNMSLESAGIRLYELLNSIYSGTPLKIVETGCLRDTEPSAIFSDGWSTYWIAKFAKNTSSSFTSVECDADSIKKCQDMLEKFNLSSSVNFICGMSPELLSSIGDVDFFFLDTCDGLTHGLSEFLETLVHHPKMVVMDDYETKAKWAVEYAETNGISVSQLQRYSVFRF